MTSDVLLYVGGDPDEISLALCVYGPDLTPSEISVLTGAQPSEAWTRGSPRHRSLTPAPEGVWLLDQRTIAPRTIHDLIGDLSRKLRPDIDWLALHQRFTVQLRVAIHSDRWNFDLELTPEDLQWLASTRAPLLFDIYAYAVRGQNKWLKKGISGRNKWCFRSMRRN